MSKLECNKAYYNHKVAMELTKRLPKVSRVSEIFKRKPYAAANDLGEILKRKKAKAAEKARHHRYYETHKEEILARRKACVHTKTQ